MGFHSRGKQLYWKEIYEFFIVLFEVASRKHKLILSTSKMCIDEKKLRFILSDYTAIRNAN